MELSCSEVPLYGQTAVYAEFDQKVYLPKDAEFYFVYDGAQQRHVVMAQRVGDNVLQASLPGHGTQEAVTVTVCLCSEGYSPVTVGCGSVTYVDNTACRLARLLVTQAGRLTVGSHHSLLTPFALTAGDLPALDEALVLALTHLRLPPGWTVLGNPPPEVPLHRESLLHLTVRWGLVKLSQFLLGLPGGVQAWTLPNEEGATPLDLALHGGHAKLTEDIANLQARRSPGFSCVQLSEDAFLQYIHTSGTLTLTVNHTAKHLLEADIRLFRKYFWDRAVLTKAIKEHEAKPTESADTPSRATETEEEIKNSVSGRPPSEKEDVQRVSSLPTGLNEQADQDRLDSDHSFDVLKKPKQPSTFLAVGPLSDRLNGDDEVYANCMVTDQVGDLDTSHINIEGLAANASESPGSALGPQSCRQKLPTETGAGLYPPKETKAAAPDSGAQQPRASPSSRAPDLRLPFGLPGSDKEQSHVKKRSSSLDALDADTEGRGPSGWPHRHCASVSQSVSGTGLPSGRELDSWETSPEADLNISRTESLSLSSGLQFKESLLSGVRSRSYSCSSPKVSLGRSPLVRDFTLCSSSKEQRAYSLPEPPAEERIQEEEWDKSMLPAKSESEKYKVSRTFSFLMNRMTSPRSKSKTKTKDAKEKEKPSQHQFVPGTFSGALQCSVCDKTILGKESLQCSSCCASVHKGCKDAASPCTKKLQEKYNKNKAQSILGNPACRDAPPPPDAAAAMAAPAPAAPAAGSVVREPQSDASRRRRSRLPPAAPPQPAGSAPCTESPFRDAISVLTCDRVLALSLILCPYAVDSSLWSDLSGEAQELEAESWSLLVDASFCSEQERDVIRRQDVIFELMRTERHHLQTLLLMAEVFRRGMREELRLARGTVDAVFPGLDALLRLHAAFFRSLSARRRESGPGPRNFLVRRIGDVLLRQFSEENADNMKRVYGEFCSHHKEAISLFKELQQNKKFQNFIKLRNSHLLARRRGIPECILLVTQRITKYPVLVERILQCTREGTEEHKDLCRALGLIKDVIAAVDVRVSQYEKSQKWLEILSKIESKTFTKLKSGHVFRKQSLVSRDRKLLHEGLVYWKTAAGRFKDILALLLTDVLLFLQEKDQKYTFAAVDQKPSVISLQKLIAREVANEERGMFLISASSAGPEMYEIHTGSKEERDGWMEAIQQAVESCPEDEGRTSESDTEERRKAEARLARLQQCREILSHQDQQICSYLEEKLHIYAELGRLSGFVDVHLEPRLLITPDPGEPPQAASLLAAALREAESLQVAVKASQRGDSSEDGCGEAAWMALLSSPALLYRTW
ncbi:rho guanine nucleotide exchange factor 28 [Erinaceus europaeus]|uniref:Rho guanine nucleotide exchange factor 28 n=1 Tax=Erinaceus europaeus TaxID=9365 RepID=A0ABM3Y7F8_ERIEU|nr:rho guanine nucleotide exchange factor 28 [Erinaceus europaeus]